MSDEMDLILKSDIVHLHAEKDGHEGTFQVHRDLIYEHVPGLREEVKFSNVLFPEPPAKVFLENIDPDVVGAVISWVYRQHPKVDQMSDGDEAGPFVELYLLAQDWRMASLQEDTMECLKVFANDDEFTADQIANIYQRTNDDSPLRELLIDERLSGLKYVLAYGGSIKEAKASIMEKAEKCAEFAADVAVAAANALMAINNE